MTSISTWLALTQVPALSPKHLDTLQQQLDLDELVNACEATLRTVQLNKTQRTQLSNINWQWVSESETWLENNTHSILPYTDPDYPLLLKQTRDAPSVLFVKGQLDALALPYLAVVGSRKALPQSLEITHEFSSCIAASGFGIVSGLALGIDGQAHKAALKHAKTLAIMGTGLLTIYPRAHAQLAQAICENGALISEFPLQASAEKWHFPKRNRTIAAISLATLVVEAGLRSGSLITAKLAANYGRDVFVIPGSIRQSRYQGSHHLIKSGAYLCDNSQELFNALCHNTLLSLFTTQKDQKIDKKALNRYNFVEKTISDPIWRKLYNAIDEQATDIETITNRCKLPIEKCTSLLTAMELANYIKSVAGGYIKTR